MYVSYFRIKLVKSVAAKRDSLLKQNRALQKDNDFLRASIKHKEEQHQKRLVQHMYTVLVLQCFPLVIAISVTNMC